MHSVLFVCVCVSDSIIKLTNQPQFCCLLNMCIDKSTQQKHAPVQTLWHAHINICAQICVVLYVCIYVHMCAYLCSPFWIIHLYKAAVVAGDLAAAVKYLCDLTDTYQRDLSKLPSGATTQPHWVQRARVCVCVDACVHVSVSSCGCCHPVPGIAAASSFFLTAALQTQLFVLLFLQCRGTHSTFIAVSDAVAQLLLAIKQQN